MKDEVKDAVIDALAEKCGRLEKKVAQLEDDIAMWQRIYHEKNARICELETRLVAAGSKRDGGGSDD